MPWEDHDRNADKIKKVAEKIALRKRYQDVEMSIFRTTNEENIRKWRSLLPQTSLFELQRAADPQVNPQALIQLGDCYMYGLKGLAEDEERGNELYEQAANNGDRSPEAITQVMMIFEQRGLHRFLTMGLNETARKNWISNYLLRYVMEEQKKGKFHELPDELKQAFNRRKAEIAQQIQNGGNVTNQENSNSGNEERLRVVTLRNESEDDRIRRLLTRALEKSRMFSKLPLNELIKQSDENIQRNNLRSAIDFLGAAIENEIWANFHGGSDREIKERTIRIIKFCYKRADCYLKLAERLRSLDDVLLCLEDCEYILDLYVYDNELENEAARFHRKLRVIENKALQLQAELSGDPIRSRPQVLLSTVDLDNSDNTNINSTARAATREERRRQVARSRPRRREPEQSQREASRSNEATIAEVTTCLKLAESEGECSICMTSWSEFVDPDTTIACVLSCKHSYCLKFVKDLKESV